MSTDLQDRLAELGIHIDAERAAFGGVRVPQRPARPSHFGRRWLTLAAALVAIVGLIGVAAVIRHRSQLGASEAAVGDAPPTGSPADAAPIVLPEHGGDFGWSQFDPIRIAPGTIGWFDATTGLPDGLAAQRNERGTEIETRSVYFRCVQWTTDADGPICTQLTGGNGIDMVAYGDTLGIGVNLGSSDLASVAGQLVRGGVIPYDAVMPPAVDLPVNGQTAKLYRVQQQTYLFWQARPGAMVWLHGNGLSDDQLITIAAGVQPVQLPAAMPVTLQLTPAVNDTLQGSSSSSGGLQLGWYRGVPCVGFEMHSECYPADRPLIVDNAQWGDGMPDQIAAVSPSGRGLTLEVDRSQAEPVRVELMPVIKGIDVAVLNVGTERATAARLINTAEETVTSLALSATGSELAEWPLVSEGRTGEIAWEVRRQDPSTPARVDGPTMQYKVGDSGQMPYCLMLAGPQEMAPLCPPTDPPPTGLGVGADYHATLNLIEVAADVATVTCAGEPMPIVTDPELTDRRFAVVACETPIANP